MKKILFEDALILNTVRVLRALVRRLPLWFSLALARGIGWVVYVFSKRRTIAYKNLRAAFAAEKSRSEMKRIARRSMQNLAMSAVELLRIPEMDLRTVHDHFRILGTEKFEPYLRQGRGLIFLTAHLGSWELLNIAAGLLGYPVVALARVQKHPRSDEFLNDLRRSKGSQVIHKGMPIREILRSLRKGKIVGILSDQDGGRAGCFVRFFNRMSSTPSGAATFSIRTEAPIFPVFIFRERLLNHRVEVEGPLVFPDAGLDAESAERVVLQQFADILESKIRKTPDQWLWAHRRWKSTPDRFVLVLDDGRTGHLRQSLAVLEAIREDRRQRQLPADRLGHKIVTIRFRSRFSKSLLRWAGLFTRGYLPFKPLLLKWALDPECYREIMGTYADIVISCGASLVEMNLLIKHENQAKSAVVMKPGVSTRFFDAVIAPSHDRLGPSRNIFVTQGALCPAGNTAPEAGAARLSEELNLGGEKKCIGLLVGGDTDRLKFSRPVFENVLRAVQQLGLESDALLLATSSRRTPAWADQLMKETLQNNPRCPLLVIANEANRNGVVGDIIGLSQLLVVSGESISMVSEAVSSAKPVVVFLPESPSVLKNRHRDFLQNLHRKGLVALASSGDIDEVLRRQFGNLSPRESDFLSNDKAVLQAAVKRLA